MLRHDRTRFIAYALPCFLNGIGLLLYALDITTSGSSEAGFFPAMILGAACLLATIPFCIKRGRDINLPAVVTCLLLFISGPVIIGLIAYLALKKSSPEADKQYGPPPDSADIRVWLNSINIIAMPWVIVMLGVTLDF